MAELRKLGNIDVKTEEFNNRGPAFNVIGTLKGTDNSTDFYIIGGNINK